MKTSKANAVPEVPADRESGTHSVVADREIDSMLARAMTGNDETREWAVVIESIEAVADDLDVLWNAVRADDAQVVDLTHFIHRLSQRAHVAAQLADLALHPDRAEVVR